MIEEIANDYAAYMKLDIYRSYQTVQDVIDNMLTRLEELNSVIQMVKEKNNGCCSIVSEDIIKYRAEVTTLSKKIVTLSDVIWKLQNNVQQIEQHVEKAELDFGINNGSKFKSLLKPFLTRNKPDVAVTSSPSNSSNEKLEFSSVMINFEVNENICDNVK